MLRLIRVDTLRRVNNVGFLVEWLIYIYIYIYTCNVSFQNKTIITVMEYFLTQSMQYIPPKPYRYDVNFINSECERGEID